jgi:hypothetical protein
MSITESSTWENHCCLDEENFSRDVTPLRSLWARLSKKQYKKSEKLPKNSQESPVTHPHLLWPPQNNHWGQHSKPRSGTDQSDFAKPKLFFKNIGRYAATSMYIHLRFPFNFTTIFNTKNLIAEVYDKLLDQNEEPFKAITKSVTDVSLAAIESSLEDFWDIIKALPQTSEISTPGRSKWFIAIGFSIMAMAMSTFNTIRITQWTHRSTL